MRALVISLDFELAWGSIDNNGFYKSRDLFKGVWDLLPTILHLFSEYEIHSTWATVGLLFCNDYKEALDFSPTLKPKYQSNNISAYDYINENRLDIINNKSIYFAPELIEEVKNTKYQEIGTHTFSHLYCLDAGVNKDVFGDDLSSCINIGKERGYNLKSIVFPRNQVNYTESLSNYGITNYRGITKTWEYNYKGNNLTGKIAKCKRFTDRYVNVSGGKCYSVLELINSTPYNIRSSRFLEPYRRKFSYLESLKVKRICNEMREACRLNSIYHLYWHPFNFTENTEKNLDNLKKILEYYSELKQKYGFLSLNMQELFNYLKHESPN